MLLRVSLLAWVLTALLPWRVLAEGPTCKPGDADCGCPKNWGCWELVYSAKGTVLGVRTTATQVIGKQHDALDLSVLGSYRMEHFGTRDHIAAHVATVVAVGGGTAGSEGLAIANLDVGWRGDLTPTGGPFLRAGTGGLLLGNQSLRLALLEPLRALAGYQILDGDTLLEAGLTQGTIAAGYYRPGENGERSLRRSSELGSYVSVHFKRVRAEASFMRVFTADTRARADLDLARAAACYYVSAFGLCADGLYVRGDATPRSSRHLVHSLYTGVTIGFTP